MVPVQGDIGVRVRAQYEAFPYPAYSLLLPLRSQEAYASHSLFAARLLEMRGGSPALRSQSRPGILLAGCGDTLPYLSACWEPSRHRITAVDLSARNLRRARLRCLPLPRTVEWRRGDLEDPDFVYPRGLCHIDCYGVLHHLADPARALAAFARALLPGGTARIMVYNSEARLWIRHLQRAFALLGLSPFDPGDLSRARRLLDRLAEISPILRDRCAPMRADAFARPARFVDTFLHARETRLGLGYWLRACDAAGLSLLGLSDRHGELDDLPNPLWSVPEAGAWRERIADRRFENNLEIYLAKPGALPAAAPPAAPSGRLLLKSPPRTWFGYEETRALPWIVRRRLWAAFLRGLAGKTRPDADAWAGRLPPEALQRLARIGVLFPGDFASEELRDLLWRPRHASMEPPDFAPGGPVQGDRELRELAAGILERRPGSRRRLEAVMRRLQMAQVP